MQYDTLEFKIVFQPVAEGFRGGTLLLGADADAIDRLTALLDLIHEGVVALLPKALLKVLGIFLVGKTPQLHHPAFRIRRDGGGS